MDIAAFSEPIIDLQSVQKFKSEYAPSLTL